MMKRTIRKIQEPRNGIQFIVYSETRKELKPLVFFDAGKFKRSDDGFTIGFHPHSGIDIITYFHGMDLHHKDSSNNPRVVYDGGAQWIRAGKGVWHEEGYRRKQETPENVEWEGSIHQLWIQLLPEVEESEVAYRNLSLEEIPRVGNVKVLAGKYNGVLGPMKIPIQMTYLDVYLKEGETWKWHTPKGQSTGFIFTRDGELEIANEIIPNSRMAILEHNEGVIEANAVSPNSNFIVVLAEPSTYNQVVQGGQIHTNLNSLKRSAAHIHAIGQGLRL